MMAGDEPPPTALIVHRVVLSTKLAAGYPQPSLPPLAAGIVIPGVHDGAPVTMLHVAPTVPPEDEQSAPLQQRFGRGDICGVHVRGGAQPPVESQRQPWLPTMHVVGAPEPAPGFASPPPVLWPPQAAMNATRTSVRIGSQSMMPEKRLRVTLLPSYPTAR